LTKISKIEFNEDEAYLVDDYKTIYLWFGKKIPKKQKDFCIKKAETLNSKRNNSAKIQKVNQNKEYGAFLAVKDILLNGVASDHSIDRRPELEIEYEDTIELIEAGIDPDLEGEITIAAHNLSQEKKSYKELCRILADKQFILLKGNKKPSEKEIEKKTKEIFESSSTYEELCWLIAELDILIKNKTII
jgi:hypothetical protein